MKNGSHCVYFMCSVVVGLFNPTDFAMCPGGEPGYTLNQLYHVDVFKPLIKVLSNTYLY